MTRRAGGTSLLAAVVLAAAAGVLAFDSSPAAAAPPASLTFAPRSSLARLDLRSGRVQSVAVGNFFSVAEPSLSPAGRLAFLATRCASCRQRLTIMHGRRAVPLVQAMGLAWLDRDTLAISVGRGEDTDLWRVRLNGRGHELEWLSESSERIGIESERELAASPNGRTLLFSGEGSTEHHGNYIVDLRRRRLFPLAGEGEGAPAFSPDGRTIAYQHVSRGGDWDICLARISLRAASDAHCFRSPGGNDREPAFLPNGRELVFASDRASPRNGVSSLYLLDLRTASTRRLTAAGYDATNATVAPDGRSVVFVRRALVPFR